MKTPRRRHQAIPRTALSPHDVLNLPNGRTPNPDAAFPRCLVVDQLTPATLLIGRSRLAQHLRFSPQAAINCYRVRPDSEDDREAIAALDGWVTLAEYGEGLAALHRSGMPLEQMREVVYGAGHKPDLSRTIKLVRESPALFAMADGSRGRIRLSHILATRFAPPAEREELLGRCLARRVSVRSLENMARSGDRGQVDASLETRLSLSLGTHVEVRHNGSAGEVTVDWYSAGDLQGLLRRLGEGTSESTNTRRRSVRIAFDDTEEFQAIFGHMLGDL
ncbi:hypothetical protein [Luteimonas sp. MHLX1A]|uniref:hypothetical protein n=1 Tax=Alterluteimonas muca TaxID=2878684 RepID=UPI001E5FD2FC|nr:hypothetical protein [Luteimonas sp. MHLX1A]MCD9046743.1 hypothetical protein [Luteimonas sp. MHLX1A]